MKPLNHKQTNSASKQAPFLRKIGLGLKSYLSDWRNLLGHALIGVGFVVAAVWVPVRIEIKLVIIACLICFNVWRMRRSGAKNKPD